MRCCPQVDQAAGSALKDAANIPAVDSVTSTGDLTQPSSHSTAFGTHDVTAAARVANVNIPPSASVPAISEKRGSSAYLTQTNRTTLNYSPGHTASTSQLAGAANTAIAATTTKTQQQQQKRDKDEELFEFLNSPDNGAAGAAAESVMARKASQSNLKSLSSGRHSRQSSVSSTVSNKSSSRVSGGGGGGGAELKSGAALSLAVTAADASSGKQRVVVWPREVS